MSKAARLLIIAFVIILICAGGYYYATSGTAPASTGGLQTSTPASASSSSASLDVNDAALGDKFLSLLLNMRSIKLDQSIFSDPAYLSLRDFTTAIPADTNPGRANPFAPIGSDAAPAAALGVTTLPPTSVTKATAVFGASVPPGTISESRYFEYGTANVTPLPNITASVPYNPTTGVFTFSIATLAPNTTYYVRAAAKIQGSVLYGAVVNFKTPAF